MFKIYSFLQVLLIGLIIFYLYQINFKISIFENPNLIFTISIVVSFIALLSTIVLKAFIKLKNYTNKAQ